MQKYDVKQFSHIISSDSNRVKDHLCAHTSADSYHILNFPWMKKKSLLTEMPYSEQTKSFAHSPMHC